MPAVLEILEKPPNPLGRAIAITIMLFLAIAGTWSYFGKVDVVAVAQGKIIPGDRVKIIQPLEIGVIREVSVFEGKDVEPGDTLIRLDRTNAKADRDRIQEELLDTEAEIVRLTTLLKTISRKTVERRVRTRNYESFIPIAFSQPELDSELQDHPTSNYQYALYPVEPELPVESISFPPKISLEVVMLQKRLFSEQLAAFKERMQGLREAIQRKKWERISLERRIIKLEDSLPLITQRTNSFYMLLQEKYASRNRYLQLEQERLETKNDLAIEKARREEISVDIAQAKLEVATLKSEFKRDRLAELVTADAKRAALTKELNKANRRQALTILTSPVAGRIQDLAVHTVGGVVTPAQELMRIVPANDSLEVEVMLANKDIGFVEIGQPVEIKLETFPFTKYGSIDGQIMDISLDSTPDENMGLIYKVRADMHRSWIQVGKRRVDLTPGMAVTLEAKTGQRRLLEYFLAPLMRGFKESARER